MDSKLVEELRQKYIKNPPAGYFNSKFLRKEEFPIIQKGHTLDGCVLPIFVTFLKITNEFFFYQDCSCLVLLTG